MTPSLLRVLNAALFLTSLLVIGFVGFLFLIERVRPAPQTGDVVAPAGTASAAKTIVGTADAQPAHTLQSIFRKGSSLPWLLDRHHAGSVATLAVSPERPDNVRVNITSASEPTPYNIQLNLPGLTVKAGESYELSFRARADRSRSIAFGISMAHAPWLGLGFYVQRQIGTEWEDFSATLVLTSSDDNARLHFDLGGSANSVELAAVMIRHLERQGS